ncbi:MAG: group II truncated hemoglobin [Proteobacteria bacterium]|nr:group II truncated hemoglobin [Pseudomonadota bacterium]
MATPLPQSDPYATAVGTLYEALGGEPAVRVLVNHFYDRMDALPQFRALRDLHAADLAPMRAKLADWLSGWLGGPPRYFERPDAICIGAAHRPYVIDAALRDAWLECMAGALQDAAVPAPVVARLRPAFAALAEALRNR